MPAIPREPGIDSTLALLSEGYRFISNRCQRHHSDVFATRLILRKVICVRGEDAARMFYEPDRFTRRGAIPISTFRLLQDEGSVAQLDGDAHRQRKQLFISLLDQDSIQQLVDQMAVQWRIALKAWPSKSEIVLHDEVQTLLCRVVCSWAGIPLSERGVRRRTREFTAMIEGSGRVGPRNWWATFLRSRSERWCRRVIEGIRAGRRPGPAERAAGIIARHREPDGALLETDVAAVELLNILRPTVAVAWFVTFAALALHEHPAWRARLETGDDDELSRFVQEVRRVYPLFPFVGGRAQRDFAWRGWQFSRGSWVLLDLYGTDHDAQTWRDPEAFRPERFQHDEINAFNLIPQGGGSYAGGHRCPGEPLTIALLKAAVRLLTQTMRYDVPEQDLAIDLTRMPTLPKSRFIITNVMPVA